ncbi:hypothetical protein HDU76_006652, partial [Blyttiomyces sp. JEL0837]
MSDSDGSTQPQDQDQDRTLSLADVDAFQNAILRLLSSRALGMRVIVDGADGLRTISGIGEDDDDEDEEENEDDDDDDDFEDEMMDYDESEESEQTESSWETVTDRATSSESSAGTSGRRTKKKQPKVGVTNNNEPIYRDEDPIRAVQDRVGLAKLLRRREIGQRPADNCRATNISMASRFIPNRGPFEIEQYQAQPYCGQFTRDGKLFYTATQDFQIHIYNAAAGFNKVKLIRGHPGSWTITDSDISRDNRNLIYSSLHDTIMMAPLDPDFLHHAGGSRIRPPIDGNEDHRHLSLDDSVGVYSIRFSDDGREVVAGCSGGLIFVYDVERQTVLHRIKAHMDDVNAVCFAEDGSSNVVLSGGDDSFLKVWDRRSGLRGSGMSGGQADRGNSARMGGHRHRRAVSDFDDDDSRIATPSGVLVGHTEGITFVAKKGDGRYCLSNGKDQKMLMWDLRRMLEPSKAGAAMRLEVSSHFDYRWDRHPKKLRWHPHDCSVKAFTGHKVLRTLIRCHFSPDSTGNRYVYTGSADGKVFIHSVDSPSRHEPVAVLDAPEPASMLVGRGMCARDVSWNPKLPEL